MAKLSPILKQATTMTYDLERMLRWEQAGATWEAIWPRAGEVTIVLCTCDSGEEVDRYTSAAPDLLEHVRTRSRAEP